jgi:serine/threonine protein kinase/Tol biopolymer transport system component
MGQVYQARDTKLHRDVALKILPDAFASDPDRLARFTREAQTLASLNHPNIAQIHGFEESGHVRALVMELVEGEDLSQRIARGALPITEALSTAKQIAEALEAAHEQGVIHRDLKPANIKVREDGTVKVLDFGLAKALEPTVAAPSNVSQSPTITTPAMTQAGMILGTAAYMSPEQAKGRAADRRSDIWAFGVVLYEMLTGRRAFKGEDVADTLACILTREPDWTTLPADTPPLIRRLLRRCLEKERRRRLDSAADARMEIEEALTAPSPADAAAAQREAAPRLAWSRALTWTLAASTLGLAIALVLLLAPWRASRGVEQPLVRLDVDLGADVSLAASAPEGASVIISPDGTRIVYVSASSGRARLVTRRLDQPRATDLEGTEGASGPFFSPDGRWVGFFARGKLSKVPVEGGLVAPLSDVPIVFGASWGDDGYVVAATGAGGLVRIPSGGGAPTPLTEPGNGETALLPQVLPGSQAVLFLSLRAGSDKQSIQQSIDVITVRDRRRKTLQRSATSPRYLPSGHLLYTKGATLFALPFDLDRLETSGTAVPVLEDVAIQPVSGLAQFDVSRSGTMVYRKDPGSAAGMTRVQWLDASGKKDTALAKPAVFSAPRLSPDGKRLALLVLEGTNQGISIYDEQRENVTRLTSSAEVYRGPVWTPDGRHIVFSTPNGIFSIRVDGAGPRQSLTPGINQTPASFTPSGKRLVYSEANRANGGAGGIWTVSIEDDGNQLRAGKPEPFLQTQSTEDNPMFSPDGRWLAFQSDESGTNEVNVRAFPAPASGHGSKLQISNGGGTRPIWSRNGRELLYRAGDQIMAVNYTVKGDSFVADKPRLWAKLEGAIDFDLAPDGKRLVVLTPVEKPGAPRADHTVVFLQNFFDELRRLVPVGQ